MIVSFACQDIEFVDLIRCSFELSKTEYSILMYLLTKEKWYTTSKLAEVIGLDRTTIQKSIKHLADKGLVKRFQENLDKGGYMYLYNIKDKEGIKKRMRNLVENWYKEVLTQIADW